MRVVENRLLKVSILFLYLLLNTCWITCWILEFSVRNNRCWELELNACFGDIRFSQKDQQRGEAVQMSRTFDSFSHPVVNCTFLCNVWTAMPAWGLTSLGSSKRGGWPGMVYPYLLSNPRFWQVPTSTVTRGRGWGLLPYMRYIGMCCPKGYGFSAILVKNTVSILATLVLNRVWVLYSTIVLNSVMLFRRSYFFIIIDQTINKRPSKCMFSGNCVTGNGCK